MIGIRIQVDAHCGTDLEQLVGWMEQLLDRIAQDNYTITCPVIDTISDDTLQYFVVLCGIKGWFSTNWGLFMGPGGRKDSVDPQILQAFLR